MRKRITHLAGMAATMLLALSACSEEENMMTALTEPQVPPVADNSGNVYITGDDFTWELGGDENEDGDATSVRPVTRTQLTIDGNIAKFAWTPGDRVGILPDAGAQVWFEIPESETPTATATFDGGAWALKTESDYAAYYPFVKDFDLDRTKVPVSYSGQKQTGNNTTAHLGAYDYQGARPSTTNGNGGVSFDFDHVGALVLVRFSLPTAGTVLKSVSLSATDVEFTTSGTYDLTSEEGFPIASTATANNLSIDMEYTTQEDKEEVTAYLMAAPVNLSDKTVNISVAYGEEETLEFQCAGKNLLAAGGYLFKQPIDASAAIVTLEQDTYIWSDYTEKKPAVTSVVLEGEILEEGTDYTVSYSNNVNVGTASVIITFKGDYTGTVTKNFTIQEDPNTGGFDGPWVPIG